MQNARELTPSNCAARDYSWKSLGQQGDWTSQSKEGDQPWIFTGRADAESEALVFWSSDVNRWLIGKVPHAGKDCGQKEKRVSEDEMAGQYHRCNEYELGQTPGDVEGQGGLACCSPWSWKELDMAAWLNNNMRKFCIYIHEETIMESTGKSLSSPFIQWLRLHLLSIQWFKETYLTSLTSVSRSVTWLIAVPISYSS